MLIPACLCIIIHISENEKKKKGEAAMPLRPALEGSMELSNLFLPEGHTVGALVNGGVALVSTYQDLIQRAVVCSLAMVGTLADGAFDALVFVHNRRLLSVKRSGVVCRR